MLIPSAQARKLVSFFGNWGAVPVGSYGRDSHRASYRDLDFLVFGDPRVVILKDLEPASEIRILRSGPNYLQIVFDDATIDFWRTSKETFYRDYIKRTLPAEKQIYLAKLLRV